MIGCLISFLLAILVVVILLWGLSVGCAALGVTVPENILMVIRVIVVLILLLYALQCLGLLGAGSTGWRPCLGRGCP